ncbi:MAG: ATP synthase F0 subunit A [Bacteroidetes bacterium]|nr:MAG: ATP synthase F0 subunit A [Bacteroidota bacterium]
MVLNSETVETIQHGAADTLHAAAQTGGHGEAEGNLFTQLLHHLKDSHEIEYPGGHLELPHFAPIHIGELTIDLSITKHVLFMWVAAIILGTIVISAARKNSRSLIPKGIGNLIEVFVQFIRDDVALPNMGKSGLKYMPYLLTTFFFILTMNLLGLIPYGASATGNISVTLALAVIAFVMIQVSAVKAQGFGHYLAHLTGGVHWMLWPIMVPIEILGLFTKPFALCIRLYANMTGGHIVIVSMIGLIFLFKSYLIAPASIGFVAAINMLELFVAFLQAYIFTMLTSLFMGLGIKAGEEHAAHEAHAGHGH